MFQRMITAATVSAILVLVVAGFWLGTGDTAHFRSAEPAMWSNFPVSLVFVMFAYSGWNAAAYLAGEIREPARNLPLALLGGTVMVTALYLALNTFYLYALPIPEMAGVQAIAEKASVAAFGQVASHLVTGMLLLALAGSVSAMVLAGPRVYFAMARDGVFPQAIASVHPRFHTPARAIFLQSTWSSILIYVSAFESLVVTQASSWYCLPAWRFWVSSCCACAARTCLAPSACPLILSFRLCSLPPHPLSRSLPSGFIRRSRCGVC